MKALNYIILLLGILMLLTLSGLKVDGSAAQIAELGLSTEVNETTGKLQLNSETSLLTTVRNIIDPTTIGAAVLAAAAVSIGLLTRGKPENYLVLPIIFAFASFATLTIQIIQLAFQQASWIGYITLLIFAPITIGFIASLGDWFRGVG